MEWRPGSNRYRAHIPGGRFYLYAFTDGSFVTVNTQTNVFDVHYDWYTASEICVKNTTNAHSVYTKLTKLAKMEDDLGLTYTTIELPPNATSSAAYTSHLGLADAPTKGIRLTAEDEMVLTKLGYSVYFNQDDGYMYYKSKEKVVFYPNNTAHYIVAKNLKIVKTIEAMLQWLSNNKQTPLNVPHSSSGTIVPKGTPGSADSYSAEMPKGQKIGTMFEGIFLSAGFYWDEAQAKYVDSEGNWINIHPYPASTVSVGGAVKEFPNLPALANFIQQAKVNGSLKKK
jgi:hypothetical protein